LRARTHYSRSLVLLIRFPVISADTKFHEWRVRVDRHFIHCLEKQRQRARFFFSFFCIFSKGKS
jgi:hypothetical protein